MSYKVFISYRRDGAAELAQLLYTCLKLDGYEPFFDVEKMRSGKFNTQLYSVIDECNDMILLLPENGLLPREGEDWVRLEIAYALERKKNIVPILMRGFSWPDQLPDDINEVRYCHGITANMEYFDAVYERLKNLLNSQPSQENSDNATNESNNRLHGKLFIAEFYLRNRAFDEAKQKFEDILSTDIECGAAYLGKFMAEHSICDKDEFRQFFEENIVYDNIDLKLSQKYADEELKEYFLTVSFPKCVFHDETATNRCDICSTLICDGCTVRIDNGKKFESSPLFHKKNICPNCMARMYSHSEKIKRRNCLHCIMHLVGVGIILALAVCFSSGELKSFFIGLGIMSGIVFFIKHGLLGELMETLMAGELVGFIIGLVLLVLISTLLAPLVLLWVIVRRVYLLIKMGLLIKAVDTKSNDITDKNKSIINAYYQLVEITDSLGLNEPEIVSKEM